MFYQNKYNTHYIQSQYFTKPKHSRTQTCGCGCSNKSSRNDLFAFYFEINICVQYLPSATYPTPMCVNEEFKMFARCPEEFIQALATA